MNKTAIFHSFKQNLTLKNVGDGFLLLNFERNSPWIIPSESAWIKELSNILPQKNLPPCGHSWKQGEDGPTSAVRARGVGPASL